MSMPNIQNKSTTPKTSSPSSVLSFQLLVAETTQNENDALPPNTTSEENPPMSALNENRNSTQISSDSKTAVIHPPQAKTKKNKTKRNINLLKELPKINPKDYIGKELCTTCHHEVKDTQQSISCDTCQRWTHRKCCKITIKKFRFLAKKKYFDWYCRNCREDDDLYENSKPDSVLILSEKQDIPDDYEIVKKTKNDLLIIHLNCRSLVKKLEELQNIIDALNPDILCLSETWFDLSVPLNSHIPDGYNIIRKDRTEDFQIKYKKNHGGGVAIIYKNYLHLEEKKSLNDKTEDILWTHVKTKNSFLLGVLYRPDYSKMLESEEESTLEKNIKQASLISNQLFITGDFNVDMRDPLNNNTISLKDTYKTYSLKQHIKKATRIDPKTGKAKIIDHIWTTPEIKIKSTGTFIGLSDHLGVYAKLPKFFTNFSHTNPIKLRDFKNYNKDNFREDFKEELQKSNINSIIKQKDLDAATQCLIDLINETASRHAPFKFKRRKRQSKVPWKTSELKEKINNKNKLLQDFYCTKNTSLKKKADSEQKIITTLKRKLKKDWIFRELQKAGTDPEKLWKIYNYLTGKHEPPEEIEPECMNQTKANNYNKYFSTIGQTLVQQTVPNTLAEFEIQKSEETGPTFCFEKESSQNICKLIDGLKEKTATGYDEVNVKLLKDLKTEICQTVTDIINLGYEIQSFPSCMKFAIIKPIYKKDNRNDISNYRPIAILPALSKLIERSAANQLIAFLEKYQKLTPSQHAYRIQHSTITCLVETIIHIYQQMDSKQHAALISLDLSKAFDCLNHKLLLHKLKKLGLENSTLNWMENYLKNRKQVTKFKNFTSDISTATTGVPQGSILGPLLFICFTNDLPQEFKNTCKINAYADDTQILVTAATIPQLKEKIEKAITTAEKWFNNNLMKINTDKTKVLVFNTDPETKKLTFNIQNSIKPIIEPSAYIEILGILVDCDLNWKKQINRIKRNAMGKIRNIHRFNSMLPLQHRKNLYNAIISPQFDYGDVLIGGANQKELNSLQRIQNFAAKSILGKKKRYSNKKTLKELQFLNLEQRRKIHRTVFIHKALLNKSSTNLHEIFSKYNPNFNTRNSTKKNLTIPSHNSSKFKRSPLYKMINDWNDTPNNLPKEDIRLHKIGYQKHLIATVLSE